MWAIANLPRQLGNTLRTALTQKPVDQTIWQLAWPMILANLSVPALGLADTAMLGHLESSRFLSAVAIGSSLLAFIYWSFGFLRMGTTGASAQAEGKDSAALLLKALAVGLSIGVTIVIAQPFLINTGLSLMDTPAKLHPLADAYLHIRLLSAPAVLCTYAVSGWLIGQHNTRTPLIIAVAVNSLNIGLDYLFIVHMDWRSEGAAWASVISEYCGFGIALLATRTALKASWQQGLSNAFKQGQPLSHFLADNGRIFMRTAALLFSFAFFTAQGAALGENILAANAILIQLVLAGAYGMDGFAHAAEALCGRAYSQKDKRRFLDCCRACGKWSLISALLATAILLIAKSPLLQLMTGLDSVRELAKTYYPWLLAMPLLSVWSYLLDGIFIGCLRTRAMQWGMLGSVFLVYLPLWYVSQPWLNHGLWLSFATFNLARGLSLGIAFYFLTRSKHWVAGNNIPTY